MTVGDTIGDGDLLSIVLFPWWLSSIPKPSGEELNTKSGDTHRMIVFGTVGTTRQASVM